MRSGTALRALAFLHLNFKTYRIRATNARSASDYNFILIMLDKFTFLRFESQTEKLLRETHESLESTKSERLVDNKVRGFFIALLD